MRQLNWIEELTSAFGSCRASGLRKTIAAGVAVAICLSSAPTVFAQATLAAVPQGQFGVSPAGAATYSIPIQVPPGIAGIEPKLSLTYNSQAGSSIGLAGMAWDLSGLATITRCPRTVAQDGVRGAVDYGYTTDRFCLNGQRLIRISGSFDGAHNAEYRTELNDFSKVISYYTSGNGPLYFKAWTKSGQVLEFGDIDSLGIRAIPETNATPLFADGSVRIWPVTKISDAKGNYLKITYDIDTTNGTYRPSRIDYTANDGLAKVAQSSVRFVYQSMSIPRPPKFQGGAMTRQTFMLSEIDTYSGATTLLNKTVLTYQNVAPSSIPRLSSVKTCDAQDLCQPTLNMTYPSPTYGFSSTKTYLPGLVYLDGVNSVLVDMNGDGLPDIYQPPYNMGTGYVKLNTGNGFAAAIPWPNSQATNGQSIMLMDVNGDGLPDLVYPYNANTSTGGYVRLNTGSGFSATQTPWTGIQLDSSTNVIFGSYQDMNGDGLPDVYPRSPQGSSLVAAAGVNLNTGSGNGNGVAWPNATMLTNAPHLNGWNNLTDVNGDGLPDLIYSSVGISDGAQTCIRWNTGRGFTNGSNCAGPYTFDGISSVVADLNGDGLLDLYTSANGNVLLQTGYGFSSSAAWPNSMTLNGSSILLSDVDGDGLPDLVVANDQNPGTAYVQFNTAKPAHLLLSVSSATGPTTTITYGRLSDPAVYTKDGGANAAVYPVIDLMRSAPVVTSVSTSDGIGGVNTVQYTYGGLKFEFGTGRGMLGFRWMNANSLSTGIQRYTEYRQDFPYTGMPTKIETRLAGSGSGGVLKRITNTMGCNLPTTGAACTVAIGNVYFPFVATQLEESWDLNGTAYPSVTTSSSYGTSPHYGDPSQTAVSSSDGFSKTTAFEYWTADITNWIVGKVKKTTVTSSK